MYTAGPLVITKEGLDIASMRTMRVFSMIAGAKILTATTEMESLINAFGKILKPLNRLGIPVNEFLSTMSLTMKSLPKLREQIVNHYRESIHDENITGFWNRTKLISIFLIPLFLKTIQSPEIFFEDELKKAFVTSRNDIKKESCCSDERKD